MERRKFPREFKLEASQDWGVHTSQLRDWVKKFSNDPQPGVPQPGADAARAVGTTSPAPPGKTYGRAPFVRVVDPGNPLCEQFCSVFPGQRA